MSESPTCKRGAELAADQLAPGQFGADARLEGVRRNAGSLEELDELLRRDVLALGHVVEGLVDLVVGHFEAVALGLGDLEPVVDQLVDDLLRASASCASRRRSACALLDVVGGDRRAVGDDHHLRAAPAPARPAASERRPPPAIGGTDVMFHEFLGIAMSIASASAGGRAAPPPALDQSPPTLLTPWLTDVPPSVRRLNCSMIVWSRTGVAAP